MKSVQSRWLSGAPSQDGVANLDQSISRTKASDMDLVKKHLMDNYGYDGSYTDFPGASK